MYQWVFLCTRDCKHDSTGKTQNKTEAMSVAGLSRDSCICHVLSYGFIFEQTTEKEWDHPLISRVSHKCPEPYSSFYFSEKFASLVNYFVIPPKRSFVGTPLKEKAHSFEVFFFLATRNTIRPLLGILSAPTAKKAQCYNKAPRCLQYWLLLA